MKFKMIALGGCAMLLAGSPSFAAMTDAQCEAAFMAADTNKDGMVTEAEGGRYFAYARIGNQSFSATSMAKADFMTQCKAGTFDDRKLDAGAPLAGANSFTESQAKDRIVAHGMSAVSALKKDDKGVWRGTAMHDGKQANVAVDYKGNVVAN